MKRLDWKYIPIAVVFIMSVALAPVFRAQEQGAITRITPVPDGAEYMVDGQAYTHATAAAWPSGSKHTLWVPNVTQSGIRMRYTFRAWDFTGGVLQANPVVVTASPAISEYRAVFDTLYGLGVVFSYCPDPTNCDSAGTVTVNGLQLDSTADVYVAANATTVLQAFPKPGYVFLGWQPGPNQVIAGFQNTVTVSSPMTVYPRFQVARKVSFATDPAELTLLVDRAPAVTPSTMEWAVETVHTVGANSPQKDRFGKWWSFQAWSDGGEVNHAYKVASSSTPAALTAKFIPAGGVSILTLPVGLKIKVDGQYNALDPYYFAWGIGETHHLEAPLQQTDEQGRVWQFASWSNGGKATQDVVVPADAENNGMRLTATYTPLTKVTVNSSLSGLGIKLDGVACNTPCEVVRNPGTQVKVSVPASVPQGDGSRADFDGWPGTAGDLTINVGDTNTSVSANYHFLNRLSAASDPVNGAVWSVLPASADGFYRTNANVAVTLTPQPGYRFRRWDGDLSGTIPSGVVTMSAPRNVKALLDAVPYIAPAGVSNAAGLTPQQAVAPGAIISIFGANLTTETLVAGDGMLPQTLGGLTVRVGDRLLPLFFVSPGQINAQLPDDLATGTQVLTISPLGVAEVRATFTVARNAPGLFPVLTDGQAMAMHEDGSAVSADSPAKAGELLTVYGTGFGPVERTRLAGFPLPQDVSYALVDGVTVQVGDASFAAEKAFAVTGRCGVDAVQFRVDRSVSGSATLRITINGADSNTVILPVQ
ncbi:MAG: hypothetical protein ABI759_26355 [Candidatus Solibacter sp.]